MTAVCRLFSMLLFTLLHLCRPEPECRQRAHSFSNCVRLARKTHKHVRALFLHYKLEELGDSKFEDRSLTLQSLPSLKIDYFHWLHMQDAERLREAVRCLNVFWVHLDLKRQQMEEEKKGQPGRLTLSMQKVHLDIRDLIHLTKIQLCRVNDTYTLSIYDPPMEKPPPAALLQAQSTWHKHLESYVVLRDLEYYLRRLVLDFILLKGRHNS